MSNKVLLVTPPDDILIDGVRLVLVDLDQSHTALISQALNKIDSIPNIVTYIWNNGNDPAWLFDKKIKSSIIFFNAESSNELLVGYLAAQKNSHFFGNLKTLASVNNRAIYDAEQIKVILENVIYNYDI